jgi:hypothetical protein
VMKGSMKRSEAAALLGRLGGKRRAEVLSPERQSEIGKIAVTARNFALSPKERKEIAKLAAKARWRKPKK